MIKLGMLCRDTVTDFAGTATARVEYLCGTTQYRLEDEAGLDGNERARWFEEGRIEPLRTGPHPHLVDATKIDDVHVRSAAAGGGDDQ